MIKKFIYNSSKYETLVLFHGLYANSGFWLNYLSFFRNYRLIIYNVNYDTFFKKKRLMLDPLPELNNDTDEYKISGVISHSLGTILANLYFGNENIPLFNICPIAFARRSHSSGFVQYISERLNLSFQDIESNLLEVDNFINCIKHNLSSSIGLNLIPNSDFHFTYDSNIENQIEFDGDHFNIEQAFVKIIFDKVGNLNKIN